MMGGATMRDTYRDQLEDIELDLARMVDIVDRKSVV